MENHSLQDPTGKYPSPPYEETQQEVPGTETAMWIKPDHGEETYVGSGKLKGRKAIITGADSGIGRAVALAFAREGADILISYLNEHEDAKETERLVTEAGRNAILVPGDISDENHCRRIIDTAAEKLGGVDILVNNAAFQMSRNSLQEVSSEEWDRTFKTNIYPLFYLCKAAEKHLKPGSSVINTTSVTAHMAPPQLVAYSATKAAIKNFTASMAQLWAEKGIRVNGVAPGPIWTPLIPSTMPAEKVREFGTDTPLKRAGQPAELASAYVLLASAESSYTTGTVLQVNGGYPSI